MHFIGVCFGIGVLVFLGFVLRSALRNKGRRVHFRCATCGASETHFERQLDVRAVVNPKCRCGAVQHFTVEGTDTSGDIETFGRSPAEAGSLVICACGSKGIVPGECDLMSIGGEAQEPVHHRPVACPRCGTPFAMARPSSAPSSSEQPVGRCACGVAPVPLKRGMVLRCPQCQQRSARIVLMS